MYSIGGDAPAKPVAASTNLDGSYLDQSAAGATTAAAINDTARVQKTRSRLLIENPAESGDDTAVGQTSPADLQTVSHQFEEDRDAKMQCSVC